VQERELVDLGVPAKPASYWLGSTVGPDGRFYVGSYPAAQLVCCDPATGKVEGLGRIPTDEKERYLIHPAVSDDNVVYCPVGLHHMELWAYDVKTKTKRQILPEELTQAQGAPQVWLAADGQVYGSAGSAKFRCRPDGIELGETKPRGPARITKTAGDIAVGNVDDEGKLALTDTKTGETTRLQTSYEGRTSEIYSVGCERDGKIYGATISPANSFSYDPATGELTDMGRISGGRIQVYDTISLPQGLFLCSYMGAHVDLFDPARPRKKGENPRYLGRVAGQERPVQWCLGPDGKLYFGTVPAKGRLGGTLTRVDPDQLAIESWPDLIPHQSIMYVAPVPETGELFCASSVQGGSSAIPTEKEACVFLWDTKTESVVFRANPVPGTRYYGRAIRAKTGIVYGLAGEKYYAFDPVKREVVFTGDLPATGAHFPGLSDEPVGPGGLIYGLAGDAVYAIDPADHSARVIARHDSLKRVRGFLVTQAGDLYYGAGPTLMRCRLLKE
jgi:outer membrane protein assembly factor BamB